MITGHGNNLYDYDKAIAYDFSSNVAFNNQSAQIIHHLKSMMDSITNYPDPNANILRQKIAKHHSVDPKCILVTNGSAEAFYLIAHLFENSKSLICYPSFSEYEDACLLYKHICHFIPISQFGDTDTENFDNVWLCSPNNPDGYLTMPEIILQQCKQNKNCYFVVDSAYTELTNYKDLQTVQSYPSNLINIKSLTKTFAIPGIRLGYIIADPQIINKLSMLRPPWSVNALAIEAGTYILDHYVLLLPDLKELIGESIYLQSELNKLQALEVIPSSTNFFLSRLRNAYSAEDLKDRLISQYGILIRDASNFRGLDSAYFRVSAQCRTANDIFIHALKNLV